MTDIKIWNAVDHAVEIKVEDASPRPDLFYHPDTSYFTVQPGNCEQWGRQSLDLIITVKDNGKETRYSKPFMSTGFASVISYIGPDQRPQDGYVAPPPPPVYTGLLFYDPTVGEGQFYGADGNGDLFGFGNGKPMTGWLKTWSHIVPGNFGGGTTTDLFFFDATRGEGAFYATDGRGDIYPLGKPLTALPKTLSHIVPGNFGGGATTGLLFYDATAGEGRFYSTDGNGNINVIGKPQTGWRKTWSHIVPGKFGRNATTGLFFFDAAVGEGSFYDTDGAGGMSLLGNVSPWAPNMCTHVVPGNFGVGTSTGVFFYSAKLGEGRFYSTDGKGGMTIIGTPQTDWRKTWSRFVPGKFSGSTNTGLLFYDATAGQAQFYATDGHGYIIAIGKPLTTWRKTWSGIFPGSFVVV